MPSPIDAVAARLAAITGVVVRAARRAALALAIAAAVCTAVLLLPAPTGFGRGGAAWWLLAGVLFVPSGIVFVFTRSVAGLGDLIEGWRRHVASVADETASAILDVADSVQTAVMERRGIGRVVTGALGLRRLLATVREVAGTATPAVAVASPGLLGLTAVAMAAGVGVGLLAIVLVLVRIVV